MKRSNDFEHSSSKKIKLNDDPNDLWGDDPDDFDIDDCLLQATQICEKHDEKRSLERNDESIAPSYSAFQGKQFYSSTQARGSTALTNGYNPPKTEDVTELVTKLKELEANCKARAGEVAILRTQLKDTKTHLDSENQRIQRELNEQLSAAKSDHKSVATKLELKNLEVANLKRNMLDVSRSVMFNVNVNASPIKNVKLSVEDGLQSKVLPIVHLDYPLRNVVSPSLFRHSPEKCISLQTASSANNVPHFGSSRFASDLKVGGNVLRARKNIASIQLNEIYLEIVALLNFDKHKLEAADSKINKILFMTLYQLSCLWRRLRNFEASTDVTRQIDAVYLNGESPCDNNTFSFFDSRPWCPNEHGIQCRQLLALLSELCMHNSYLRKYLTGIEPLQLNEEEYGKYLNNAQFDDNIGRLTRDNYFLDAVSSITEIIGRVRKTYYCGILSSVCLLLTKLCRSMSNISDNLCKTISSLMKRIVLSRPSPLVLYHFTRLLKTVSVHRCLVDRLCEKPEERKPKRKTKNGNIIINEGCSTLEAFALLVKSNLGKDKKSDVETYRKYLNILHFVTDAFYSDANLLYHQENKNYDCVLEANKLSLEIMYVVFIESPWKSIKSKEIENFVKRITQISIKLLQFLESEGNICTLNRLIKVTLVDVCKYFNIPAQDIVELVNSQTDHQQVNKARLSSIALWTSNGNPS